jgi:hypothetical protein
MLKFLWKDWVFNRNLLLVFLIYVTIFWVWASKLAANMTLREALVFSSFLLAMSSLTPLTREGRFQATALTCSLPTDRRTIVTARYFCSWVLMLGGTAYGLTLAAAVPASRFAPAELLTIKSLLLLLFFLSAFLAPLLPFTIRFGYLGIIGFLVAAQLLGLILLGIAEALGKNSPLHSAGKTLGAGFRWIMEREVTPAFILGLLGMILLLNLVSLKLSQHLFARREL